MGASSISRPGSMAGWLRNLRPRRKTSDSDTRRAPPRTLSLAPGRDVDLNRKWPHGNLTSSTRMAQESGSGRQLAQVQTWTHLASQIIPPRKYSPCPRARMQDPTGPGPGIRTGPGRTPGRTAAAAHHPRHRTGTTLGDFTRKLQTNVLTRRPGLGPGPVILYPGAARQRTRDWAAPLDIPAAPGMEWPSQPTLTRQHHGPALRHPNLAGSSTATTT